MDDDKLYTPTVIQDNPLPGEVSQSQPSSSSSSSSTHTPTSIKDTSTPRKIIAQETISSSLNTKSKKILGDFALADSGAISVGKYTNGVSGDVRITPSGITARDISGNTTFAIDGDTGSATFKGTIQAGTLIGEQVIVGNNTWIIDGDSQRPRILLYNNGIPEILIGVGD